MPRAKKNRPPLPPKRCPVCATEFTPNTAGQVYCDEHKNRHSSSGLDRRRLGAAERPADYYKPKQCSEPGCEAVFTPRTGTAKYCDDHQGIDRWSRDNPDLRRAKGRTATRRSRHKAAWGDPDIYDKLVAKHGERCGICKAEPAQEGWHLAVDHDHATGAVRGLLCPRCNTGLGYFDDDALRLRAAARYVS